MLERSIKIRKGLDATTAQPKWRSSEIIEEEWYKIKEAIEFLKPFAETTKYVERFKHPIFCSVSPLYNKLFDHLRKWSADVNHSFKSDAPLRKLK